MQGRGSVAVAVTVLACLVAGDNSGCEYDTCSECISAAGCIWCSKQNITSVVMDTGGTLPHCITEESSNINKFREECGDAIHDPMTVQEIKEDAEPSSGKYLRPQRVSLKMRAGESTRITLKYKHRVNYPMDLYCLMDGSRSMAELKATLATVTTELVDDLKNITPNVQLGFGMFVDKPMLPYTDMNSWKLSTCKDCTETFSFKNILSLTTDQELFKAKVSSTPGSKNTDVPEGTLEALMQVASCRTAVGWREKALKVVVVFTDAGFHLAGDGKLAGIVRPNDQKCHLDAEGLYTHSMWQDYPSVSELKSVLEHNNVTTTFAVSKALLPLYQLLAKQLDRSSCSEMDKHSNIVKLIVEPVRDIIGTVTLSLKNPMPEVAVNVSSRCKNGTEQATDTCKGMLSDNTAEFFLDIKIKKCPADHKHTTLNFVLDGHSQNFLLDLEMLCQCTCDVETDEFTTDADDCNKHGDLKCGVCDCHEGYLGKKCQCTTGDSSSQDIDEESCIHPNETKTVPCSGQGTCVCGQCKCNDRSNPEEVISGRYCQCTNYHKDCLGNNGEICSAHGECNCNKCDCHDGWKGQNCSCSSNTDNCIDSEGEVCSNHGKCVCNRCECEEDYEGKHCENCKICDAMCERHNPCIECLVFQTGIHTGAGCGDACSSYKVTIISDMTKDYGYLCSNTDSDGCGFLYQFKENGTGVFVWAQNQKECPKEVNIWTVVGGVLAGVVLVGLLLLIAWKVITKIKDQREYSAFLLQKENAVWNDNVSPLYKPATTEVNNPLFEGTSAEQG